MVREVASAETSLIPANGSAKQMEVGRQTLAKLHACPTPGMAPCSNPCPTLDPRIQPLHLRHDQTRPFYPQRSHPRHGYHFPNHLTLTAMSTRWSKNSAVQQPPPVCRKPPGLLPAPEPPFNRRTMQSFAEIQYPSITPPFAVAAYFDLPPEPPDTVWENGTNYPLDNIAVEIFSPPPYQFFNIILAAFRGATLLATQTWSNVVADTISPFSLPFLEHRGTAPPSFFQVKIRI